MTFNGHFGVGFQELCAAVGGAGTDDDALIRVVTTRAEVDMQYIKLEFTNESKKTIEEVIANETTGNYRYFLLTLVGPGDLGLFSPRTSNGSASFYSPRTSNGSASRQVSTGSQNGSILLSCELFQRLVETLHSCKWSRGHLVELRVTESLDRFPLPLHLKNTRLLPVRCAKS